MFIDLKKLNYNNNLYLCLNNNPCSFHVGIVVFNSLVQYFHIETAKRLIEFNNIMFYYKLKSMKISLIDFKKKVVKILRILGQRTTNLLIVLLESKQAFTTAELAEKLSVSARTIRSDLKKLQAWLKEKEDVVLSIKPGVGVSLKISEEKRKMLKQKFSKSLV